MLTDEEYMIAFINNLSEWDWDLYPKFTVDQMTGKALIRAYWNMTQKINAQEKNS